MEELILFLLELIFNTAWVFGLEKTQRKPRSLVNSIALYSFWGIFAGAVSFYFFRNAVIHNEILRVVNLIITPAIVGSIMVGLTNLKLVKEPSSKHAFCKGFALAFFVGLVRFVSLNQVGR